MRQRYAFSIAALCLAAAAGPASARDCPTHDPDEMRQLIASASTCEEAIRIFRGCAIGASLDARLSVPVRDVCEKSFLGRMNAAERDAFEAEINACNEQYARRQGTGYRAAAAHCRVDVMARIAQGH